MRLILVTERFPSRSQTFIVSKFVGLVDAGVDTILLCDELDLDAWRRHPVLGERPDLRDRVLRGHPGKDPRRLWLETTTLARQARHPIRTARFVARRGTDGGRGGVARVLLDMPLHRLRPDVVSFAFATQAEKRTAVLPLLDCPVTVSVRGFDVNYVGLDVPGAYDEVWASVSAVHTLGVDLWRRALRRGADPTTPVRIIPPAVDVDRFAPVERPDRSRLGTVDRPVRLVTVARLHWKKGILDLVRAVGLLRRRGVEVQVDLLGDGPARPEIEAAATDLGVLERIRFRGHVPHDAVPALLAGADVVVHPAVSEGFANAVVEAQACGVPVVCTDADGLADNVADGVTGLVVARRDPAALADAVERLAGDPALRNRLGAAGRERVLDAFRLDDQIERFVDFYEGVAVGRLPDPLPLDEPPVWDPTQVMVS